MWQTRTDALRYLEDRHPSRLVVVNRAFELLDRCIETYEASADESVYAKACGLSTLKAKNLALGAFSLILDGLGQEAGALLRPMIEYAELLTYLKAHPDQAQRAVDNQLPKAGDRARAINGIYQPLRKHLNEHASHSSFSEHALSHLLDEKLRFRKTQVAVPHVLDRNVRDMVVQLMLLVDEAVICLEHLAPKELESLALDAERLKERLLSVFELEG